MKKSGCAAIALTLVLAACAGQPQTGRTFDQSPQLNQLLPSLCSLANHTCVPAITVSGTTIAPIADQHFYSANHLIIWTVATSGWQFPSDPAAAIAFKTNVGDEFTCRVGLQGALLLCFNRHSVTPAKYVYQIRLTNPDGSVVIQTPDPIIFND